MFNTDQLTRMKEGLLSQKRGTGMEAAILRGFAPQVLSLENSVKIVEINFLDFDEMFEELEADETLTVTTMSLEQFLNC